MDFAGVLAQGRRQFNLEETVKLIIVQRLDLPSSKLRTQERQGDHGFAEIDLQNMYRTMDAIEPLSGAFQQKAFKTIRALPGLVDCFFFDVTTLYFESVNKTNSENLVSAKTKNITLYNGVGIRRGYRREFLWHMKYSRVI